MKYCEYEVDPSFVSRHGTVKWVGTGNGEYIIAMKGGRRFFVKRNMHVRYPVKGEPKAVYDKYKAEADALAKKQERLRTLMKGLDLATDHIVVEEKNFWDSDRMFVTITSCIAGALPDTYDYSVLSLESFLGLAGRAAETLAKLHAHGVIHGDLKEKNILVTHADNVYTPYLIDFDSSYPADAVPAWESIGGSEGYQSPEVVLYGSDEGAADKSTVTAATDIFSLGIVFHRWWTGCFPGIDLEHGSVGAAVYLDKPVQLDRKFDVRIGDECGATLRSLLGWMLAKNPADRPTAQQVADVIADKIEIPEAYHKGGDEKPFDGKLWDAHTLTAELLPVETIRKAGVKSLRRIRDGGGSNGLKYRMVAADGTKKILNISELCDAGFARRKRALIEEPWDDTIEFESADDIVRKGYAAIKKTQGVFGKKLYLITTVSGRQFDKSCAWLISEGLAHPKSIEIDADTPWEEHGSAYNTEELARMGVKSISRVVVGGEYRYKIVYHEMVDGKNKTAASVSGNNIRLMGFLRK